ncbi:MAG: hypothetical protein ABIP93_20915 [Gemmatimonadaceae bacterium]
MPTAEPPDFHIVVPPYGRPYLWAVGETARWPFATSPRVFSNMLSLSVGDRQVHGVVYTDGGISETQSAAIESLVSAAFGDR